VSRVNVIGSREHRRVLFEPRTGRCGLRGRDYRDRALLATISAALVLCARRDRGRSLHARIAASTTRPSTVFLGPSRDPTDHRLLSPKKKSSSSARPFDWADRGKLERKRADQSNRTSITPAARETVVRFHRGRERHFCHARGSRLRPLGCYWRSLSAVCAACAESSLPGKDPRRPRLRSLFHIVESIASLSPRRAGSKFRSPSSRRSSNSGRRRSRQRTSLSKA